ncbi:MAG: dehydrogenase, partial [Chloroflexi bacterium]|nr:dehydrogenase [Chloroflexota bacterium]
VLPACSFFECNDVIVHGGQASNDYIQLQEKAIEPLYESRSDFHMFAALARRLGMEGFMDKSEEESIQLVLASGHPTMEGITLERLRQSPMLPSHPYADFKTPSGRLEFYAEQLKPFGEELPLYREPVEGARSPLARKHPLVFYSTHTRYRVHSQFANVPWVREFDPELVLTMNPADAEARGIRDGDRVRVFNDRGAMKLKARVSAGISPGLVNTPQGFSPWDYTEGTHQSLTHEAINPAQQAAYEPNAALYDVLVEVERAVAG